MIAEQHKQMDISRSNKAPRRGDKRRARSRLVEPRRWIVAPRLRNPDQPRRAD